MSGSGAVGGEEGFKKHHEGEGGVDGGGCGELGSIVLHWLENNSTADPILTSNKQAANLCISWHDQFADDISTRYGTISMFPWTWDPNLGSFIKIALRV